MKIGLISVTLNAEFPRIEILRNNGFTDINHYLDEKLQKMIQEEGKITERSMNRMTGMIEHAVLEGAEAVVLTCTVFTLVIERFKILFKVPVISADGVMLSLFWHRYLWLRLPCWLNMRN